MEDVEIIIKRKAKRLQPARSTVLVPSPSSPLREFAPTSDSIKLNKLKVRHLVAKRKEYAQQVAVIQRQRQAQRVEHTYIMQNLLAQNSNADTGSCLGQPLHRREDLQSD